MSKHPSTKPGFLRRIFPAKKQKEQLTAEQQIVLPVEQQDEKQVNRQIQRRTFLSFTSFLVLGAAAWKGWFWLKNQPGDQGLKGGVQEPLRKVLNANERVFQHALSPGHMAKTYPPSTALQHVRVNGDIGLDKTNFDAAKWTLEVTRADNTILSVTLDQIKQLPKTEIVFDFKCIEGWSMITHWGGVKFSDFMKAFHFDAETTMHYIGLMTPDQDYYVGIDMPSAMHPQTLLCYEMNGQPLTSDHGYPLRLIIPVKYGVKNLKRIGSLYFSNDRPDDYWFERGYDYFSGL